MFSFKQLNLREIIGIGVVMLNQKVLFFVCFIEGGIQMRLLNIHVLFETIEPNKRVKKINDKEVEGMVPGHCNIKREGEIS